MTQASKSSQAVPKEGCVKAGCSSSTIGCRESIMVHMGALRSLGLLLTLKDTRDPLLLQPRPGPGKSVRLFTKTCESPVTQGTGSALGVGNGAVYYDIYWQFLAYKEGGGIAQMRWLRAKGDLSADDLAAWELIDKGTPDEVWEGNKKLFYHEQHDILQPWAFDRLPGFPGANVGEDMARGSVPLFPGNTPFKNVGKNLAVFRERWDEWIAKRLWPEWRAYSTDAKNWVGLKAKMEELANPNR